MTELLRLESCGHTWEGASEPLFQNVSAVVRAGERHSISGPSGSGKTTLALIMAGLLKPSRGRVVRTPALKSRRAPVRMIFQDPFASMDPLWRVREWLKDNCPKATPFERVIELCTEFELPLDLLDRYPLELSGGECQRFNLISALLGEPLLLILDEATSMVDKRAARQMVMLIERQRHDRELSVINIEHSILDSSNEVMSIRGVRDGQAEH